MRYSLVDESKQPWFAEDFGSESDAAKYWEIEERAVDFQKAVENRTFALYESFYHDLMVKDLAATFAEAVKSQSHGE